MATEVATGVPAWLPAVTALAGALIGSLASIIVGVINGRAEARRERLRLATQLAIEEHHHLVEHGRRVANAGGREVGIAPISAMVAYHVSVLELPQKRARLRPEEFVALRDQNLTVFEALAAESPAKPKSGGGP